MNNIVTSALRFGMTSRQYEQLEEMVIKPLKMKGCKVFIFGSRTTQTHHPYSDVDILFEKISPDCISHREIASLKDTLENSSFPFKVDLVDTVELAAS